MIKIRCFLIYFCIFALFFSVSISASSYSYGLSDAVGVRGPKRIDGRVVAVPQGWANDGMSMSRSGGRRAPAVSAFDASDLAYPPPASLKKDKPPAHKPHVPRGIRSLCEGTVKTLINRQDYENGPDFSIEVLGIIIKGLELCGEPELCDMQARQLEKLCRYIEGKAQALKFSHGVESVKNISPEAIYEALIEIIESFRVGCGIAPYGKLHQRVWDRCFVGVTRRIFEESVEPRSAAYALALQLWFTGWNTYFSAATYFFVSDVIYSGEGKAQKITFMHPERVFIMDSDLEEGSPPPGPDDGQIGGKTLHAFEHKIWATPQQQTIMGTLEAMKVERNTSSVAANISPPGGSPPRAGSGVEADALAQA